MIAAILRGLVLGYTAITMAQDFILESPAFRSGGDIPKLYTCDDENISPPLAWRGAPPQTKSFALIVDDPDAPDPSHPQMTWVHWVVYNIPAETQELAEGGVRLPPGAREGINDGHRRGYGGPCPPKGRHRYVHKLYALNVILSEQGYLTKAQLERAMEGHVIAETQLVGMYSRQHEACERPPGL